MAMAMAMETEIPYPAYKRRWIDRLRVDFFLLGFPLLCLSDRWLGLAFGYIKCPDICPLLGHRLSYRLF